MVLHVRCLYLTYQNTRLTCNLRVIARQTPVPHVPEHKTYLCCWCYQYFTTQIWVLSLFWLENDSDDDNYKVLFITMSKKILSLHCPNVYMYISGLDGLDPTNRGIVLQKHLSMLVQTLRMINANLCTNVICSDRSSYCDDIVIDTATFWDFQHFCQNL